MNKDELKLKNIYKSMVEIRLTEETIARRYTDWEMRCPTHLSIGQEAVASGVSGCLTNNDFVLSTHRSHAHYIAKGGDLNSMIAEIYGKETGCSAGKGGSMHLIDTSVGFMGSTAIVGNTIPVAVGLALSLQLKQVNSVSCVFFGDGAVEEGAFYESVNFAILKNLPVLFICENNLYSVYSPLNVRQPERRKIHKMVKAFGIDTTNGDGNNVSEVFKITKEAIKKIKSGGGPQFIEFSTYRWLEHCGPNYDNNIGYRSEKEFIEWKKNDPILHCEEKLLTLSDKEINQIKEKAQLKIDKAFDFAKESPFPESEKAFMGLFKK
jgi:TPP-dependent pyruvate/acetoin dehydrogenase alpha subunit